MVHFAISKSDGFSALLKTKPVSKTKRLMLHWSQSSENASIGMLIPKRLVKRAVDRHTLKRLFRHAVLHPDSNARGQMLVRVTKPVTSVGDASRDEWWKEIRQLLSVLSRPS